MEYTNIYKFKFLYDSTEDGIYERLVVAESEDEAWYKITTHFELMHREGYAKPIHIYDPTVELEGVII